MQSFVTEWIEALGGVYPNPPLQREATDSMRHILTALKTLTPTEIVILGRKLRNSNAEILLNNGITKSRT